jgi:hypothetical protein
MINKNLFYEKTFWRVFDVLTSIEREAGSENIQTLSKRIESIANITKRTVKELIKSYKLS